MAFFDFLAVDDEEPEVPTVLVVLAAAVLRFEGEATAELTTTGKPVEAVVEVLEAFFLLLLPLVFFLSVNATLILVAGALAFLPFGDLLENEPDDREGEDEHD